MFKRLLRVLFVAPRQDALLPIVLRLAQRDEFSCWMEVRGMATDEGPDAAALAWADLLILLDPDMPAPDATSLAQVQCQKKIWDLRIEDGDTAAPAILARLRGLVGGLQMLSRMA